MRDETYTPFAGRRLDVPVPMRTLRRFTKAGGHVAELRERTVTQFHAIEWMLFVDGSMIEPRMYHGARLEAYPRELEDVAAHLGDAGWTEDLDTIAHSVFGRE